MDEETRKKVFDPFFSTKSAYAKNNLGIQGTGLGLSVCLRIIKGHDGMIEVQSEINEGATFIVTLPIIDITEELEILKKIETEKLKKLPNQPNILIIDDEKIFLETFARTLQAAGYKNILTASTGEKAIDIVQRVSLDIIFLDMILPDMSGEEILNKLRTINKDMPVVYISGQIGLEIEKLVNDKNVFGFIQKPFIIGEVIEMINKIIDKRR